MDEEIPERPARLAVDPNIANAGPRLDDVGWLRVRGLLDDLTTRDADNRRVLAERFISKLEDLTQNADDGTLGDLEAILRNHTTVLLENYLINQFKKDATPKEISWLDTFLPTIVAVATFGGSITFTLIPTTLNNPSIFSTSTITVFLSLAWLFFLLALGVASVSALVLSFRRDEIYQAINDKEPPGSMLIQRLGVYFITKLPISLLLQEFVLAAFLFLALVVVAYSKVVGIAAVVVTGSSIVVAPVVWTLEVLYGGMESRRTPSTAPSKAAPVSTAEGVEVKTSSRKIGRRGGSRPSEIRSRGTFSQDDNLQFEA